MRKKGFTLIELLAVIVILAMIALIATPIVLSILAKVRKSAFQDSAYGIMEAAKSYYAESILEENNPVDQVFSFEEGTTNELSYSGSKPKGGILTLSKDGEIELAIHNNELCAIKSKTDINVKLIKYEKEKCKIPDSAKNPVITLKGNKEITLKVGATYTEPGVESKTLDGSSLEYKIVIKRGNEVVENINTSIEGTYTITYTAESNGKTASVIRTVIIEISNVDTSKANIPVLNGLVPIKWNGTKWIKADENNPSGEYQWYDYNSGMWANAVSVISSYRNVEVGTEIPESAINAYFVWIPRYEYQYTNLGTSYAGGTQEQPGEIKVNFIGKDVITSSSSDYKVHPAFAFGTDELSGIWVGKFETTGDVNTPTIKPNLSSLRSQAVSELFIIAQKFSSNLSIYGITLSADAHMMKNSEWGAVAYLSQSKYGKYGNSNYSGANKEIYINNNSNYITGCSAGAPSIGYTSSCMYTYEKNLDGTGASTSGTIYGVYDMSGGAWEYVMGNYNGTIGKSGFSSFPSSKYYDTYTSETDRTACNEGICYGHALSETAGWYGDYVYFVYSTYPWFVHGGGYGSASDTLKAGVFATHNASGTAYSFDSFRVVLSSGL